MPTTEACLAPHWGGRHEGANFQTSVIGVGIIMLVVITSGQG